MSTKGCLTSVPCFLASFVDDRIINLSVLCLPLMFFYRICFSSLIFISLSTSTSQLSPVLHVLSHSAHFVPAFIYPVVLCCALLCPALFCCVKFPPVLYCFALTKSSHAISHISVIFFAETRRDFTTSN